MDPELVVKFKGDLKDWDAAIAKAKADLAMLDSYLRKAAQAQNISARATANDTAATNQLTAALNNLKRGLSDTAAATKANTDATKSNTDALGKAKTNTEKFSDTNDKAGISIGKFAAGYLTLAAAMKAGQIFLDSTKEVQKFENQLKVASGTQQDYGKNMQFLEGLADKYNKNVIDLGANFAKLTIATRGTNLEGAKTERLFAAVTATSAALQMSVDDTNGTFNAFIQMVSKGNVQAEELRGQLGERLYGAFNLAAKSMGVTTSELNKMLEQGKVLASDLIPKMIVGLEELGAKGVENAQNLGSAIDYATGQLTLLIAEAGKTSGITTFFTQATKDAGGFFNKLRSVNSEYGTFAAIAASLAGGISSLASPFTGGVSADPLALLASRSHKIPDAKTPTQSNVSTDDYGAQFGINDPNKKATAQIMRATEAAARKAEAAVNKWVSEQIKDSNQRIEEGIVDYNLRVAQDKADRPGAGTGYATNTGTGIKFNPETMGGQFGFTNPVTGDGGATTNYDGIIAGMDKTIADVQQRYQYLNSLTDDFGTQLNDNINNALGTAIVSSVEGLGTLAAGLATGTADMADVGNAFMSIMATLFDNIGKALAAHAATLILAKASISTMNIAGSLAGAVLAFGAAAVARASIKDSSAGAFWTGGVVPGYGGGVDKVHAMVTPGEMIINRGQQGRLFGILSGANNGMDIGSGRSGGSRGGDFDGVLSTRIRSGDIDVVAKIGERKNNYYR